jgi:signal transduction histidine kinase
MNTPVVTRLLIVDDEAAQVVALCQTLQANGYATTGVESATQALQLLREGTFDILITDFIMPDIDGIALLRAAREIDPDLIGIMMTGQGTVDSAVEAMKSGALDYILKPFNLSGILPVLSRATAVRRLRVENAVLAQRIADRTAELENANRELRTANQDLDAFNHSVSHDLRAPLNASIRFTELLIDETLGTLNAGQKEYLTDIYNCSRRQLLLIDGLMRLARLSHQPLIKQRVHVGQMVEEVIREIRGAEPHHNVTTQIGVLPDAEADPTLLRQVFFNLLSNAFKFTRHTADASVEVQGRENALGSTYVIRDNGAGFDMKYAYRLFTIFQRLHGEEQFEGAGVGLSIVRRIIERHGGHISAQAQIDKGACFTITLTSQTGVVLSTDGAAGNPVMHPNGVGS